MSGRARERSRIAAVALGLGSSLGCANILGIHDLDAGDSVQGVGATGDGGAETSGVVPAVFPYAPSNFDPGAVDWSSARDVLDELPPTIGTVTMSDGSLADLALARTLLIEQTVSLQVAGARPLIIAVLGTVDIQGKLLVNPGTTGGFMAGSSPGPGAGAGMAGGSYCGTGGAAGATPQAAGGTPYGSPTLVPLTGGSAGGSTGGGYNCGGAGGGAIQLSAGISILVRAVGAIAAGGGGGSCGGGSGGAVVLEAPSVTVEGAVAVNGAGGGSYNSDATPDDQAAPGAAGMGGNGSAGSHINGGNSPATKGGSGGGGAGRIRINAQAGSLTASGIVSPRLEGSGDGGTVCATQGTLAP